MNFVVIRLGKDSTTDIQRIDSVNVKEFTAFTFSFTCKQVEQTITEESVAFVYLGSDNNKGLATKWKQGLRAIGIIKSLTPGSFQESRTMEIEVVSVFRESYRQIDFLHKTPLFYREFGEYPVIGVSSSRNNAIQKVNEGEFVNSTALLGAIQILDSNVVEQLRVSFPEILPLLDFKPNNIDGSREKSTSSDISVGRARNLIVFGPPGTGKSYAIRKMLTGVQEENIESITFHPETSYYDFVGGYKPISNDGRINYEFVPQVFTQIYVKAWNNLASHFYLVIDEINRGNCAEIFGDIFQLLDRSGNYRITPSIELGRYLQESIHYQGQEGIGSGKMQMPPNLSIIASMNTSDQSLYPLDSAFKRRWEWKYQPIQYSEYYETGEVNRSWRYRVEIGDQYFRWIDFILKINELIIADATLGADKCLGNYFIVSETETISLEDFIQKVLFYLWDDVFKDNIDSPLREVGTFADFFPVQSNGAMVTRQLLEEIDVELYQA